MMSSQTTNGYLLFFTDNDSDRKSCKYFPTVVPRQFLQRTQDHQETAVHHVVQWYVSVINCFISIDTKRK